MDILPRIRTALADERFSANLVALYGLIIALVIVSLVVRRMLLRGGVGLAELTGQEWLRAVTGKASRIGVPVAEVPIHHRSRTAGNSVVYKHGRVPGIAWRNTSGLFKLWLKT